MTSTFPYHFTGDRRSVNLSQCAYTRSSNKLPLKSSLFIFEGMIYTIYNQLVALIPYRNLSSSLRTNCQSGVNG